VPYRDRPKPAIDCLDCGSKDAMRLQNAEGTVPTNIPLLYICSACGCTYTVPPPRSPVALTRRDK
jgi:DNA-directed RNA polymerase subunit RPC12/RpoP